MSQTLVFFNFLSDFHIERVEQDQPDRVISAKVLQSRCITLRGDVHTNLVIHHLLSQHTVNEVTANILKVKVGVEQTQHLVEKK